jgi:hypothetical protein
MNTKRRNAFSGKMFGVVLIAVVLLFITACPFKVVNVTALAPAADQKVIVTLVFNKLVDSTTLTAPGTVKVELIQKRGGVTVNTYGPIAGVFIPPASPPPAGEFHTVFVSNQTLANLITSPPLAVGDTVDARITLDGSLPAPIIKAMGGEELGGDYVSGLIRIYP